MEPSIFSSSACISQKINSAHSELVNRKWLLPFSFKRFRFQSIPDNSAVCTQNAFVPNHYKLDQQNSKRSRNDGVGNDKRGYLLVSLSSESRHFWASNWVTQDQWSHLVLTIEKMFSTFQGNRNWTKWPINSKAALIPIYLICFSCPIAYNWFKISYNFWTM